MLILGLICLVLGYLIGISILKTIGIVLLIIGLILLVLGTGGPVRGRWY